MYIKLYREIDNQSSRTRKDNVITDTRDRIVKHICTETVKYHMSKVCRNAMREVKMDANSSNAKEWVW